AASVPMGSLLQAKKSNKSKKGSFFIIIDLYFERLEKVILLNDINLLFKPSQNLF
ncbi:MAG: hypothetical protein ACI81W_002861, partial [Saprospiraceae bacterium]